jgi:hypothetical protein
MLDLFVYAYAAIMTVVIISGLYWAISLYLEGRKK